MERKLELSSSCWSMLCVDDIHSGSNRNNHSILVLSRFPLTKTQRLRQGLHLPSQILPKHMSVAELTSSHELIYQIKFNHKEKTSAE